MSMDTTPPDGTQPDPGGNAIVPTPSVQASFPLLALAAVIVGAGVFLVAEWDRRAGWALAFLLLLGIALRYPSFGAELVKLLGGSAPNQQNSAQGNPADVTNAPSAFRIQTYTDQINVPTFPSATA